MQGRVPVRAGELHYADAGSGPPVVLLHGGLLDLTMWDELAEELAPAYRVIRYDARSQGRSSTATGDYRHDDDLADLLAALGVRRAALVGLSLGARIALDLAVRRPGLVWALVASAPGISGMEFRDPYIARCSRRQAAAAAAGDADGFVEAFLRAWVDGPRRAPHEVAPAVRDRCRAMAAANVARHAGATGQWLQRHAIDKLEAVRAPTLAIAGDADSPDILGAATLVGAEVPGARRLELPGAGHMLNLEAPAAFRDAVLDHLDRAAGRA
ncbi:alpha/beta fold hydrolase [Spirilliplanes yamanashiensis]|uniref:Alpha/beta hydrolase n=1 Tax=Spirilliplanes yamanashiensis TaxID=42233 RepID=A0A8J3Y4W8_9ACTN|nr:alpha/beta fold hydrolase [Spirilliplanes yamanashiensis]MDP9819346.1 pimeloyl-ACP methyl ester carboxylesterase [Spirilliplanes yamanashiensis]GIJ01831.1 alpha/beta hydrolase [Spirilliplanes yamanashiensis]